MVFDKMPEAFTGNRMTTFTDGTETTDLLEQKNEAGLLHTSPNINSKWINYLNMY